MYATPGVSVKFFPNGIFTSALAYRALKSAFLEFATVYSAFSYVPFVGKAMESLLSWVSDASR